MTIDKTKLLRAKDIAAVAKADTPRAASDAATLQEALIEITALKARVTALEGGV